MGQTSHRNGDGFRGEVVVLEARGQLQQRARAREPPHVFVYVVVTVHNLLQVAELLDRELLDERARLLIDHRVPVG
eukprot:3166492-Pyramimonas_sp.AAC.1